MGNGIDLVKKYSLEEAVKRIQSINEYTFYSPTMVEDDQDGNGQTQGMDGQQEPMQGDMNGAPQGQPTGNMPIDQNVNGEDIPMDGQDMQWRPNQNEIPMEEPNQEVTDGTIPMDDGEDIEDVEMDTEQPGDEVVDVDELTQSQEATEFKVDDVDDKLNKVLKVISKFNDAIDINDKKIEDLKKEFEKRNPTQQEILNLRSLSSYPYSEKPNEYWKKQQELHPNYKIVSDNDVPTSDGQQEFEIRKGDIDNFNEREVMKSLGESDMKLSDFLNF